MIGNQGLKTIGVGYASFKFDNIPFDLPEFDYHIIFSKGADNLFFARCLEYNTLIHGNSINEVIDFILEDIAKMLHISIKQKNYTELFGYRSENDYWKEYNQFKEKVKINYLNKISIYNKDKKNIDLIPAGKLNHSYSIINTGEIVLKETWFDTNAA
ncbi:MAG TPA: hypothetical protein PKY81_10440 [bacterium]|nr:hypothetical protein [bacterium]HPN31365.1 hypothetical protein [bacterium]